MQSPGDGPDLGVPGSLDPQIVGEEHHTVARGVQRILQRYEDLQDIILTAPACDALLRPIRGSVPRESHELRRHGPGRLIVPAPLPW